MTADALKQAIIAENGKSAFSADIAVSGFNLEGDEPLDMGGGNLAPAPYDYLVAALGSCTVMTMRWYARQKNWPLEKAAAVVTHEKKDGKDVFVKRIIVEGEGLSAEQRARLLDVAAKCPVHKTLAAGSELHTAWQE